MTEIDTLAPIYLPDSTYRRVVDALQHVPADLGTGETDPNVIKLTLGEHGAIFPASLLAHDNPGANSPALDAARSIAHGLTKLGARNLPADFLDGYEADMSAMAKRSIS